MAHYRSDILNNLTRRVNSFSEGYRQNIAIIGDPCIGKTSLIKSLLSSSDIKKDAVIPIYLEIKIEPFEFCVKRFIKSALFQILRADPLLGAPHDTVLLIEDLRRTYPKTAQICLRTLQDIEKNRFDEAFSFMLDITATIFEESQRRCILILDEFHNLDNFTLKHPFNTLAKKIMLQKDTMYLLLSSKNTVSQRLLNEKLSMLFGNFEKIILPPFDIDASRSFLREHTKEVSFPQAYLDFIASFTGNRPFYMRLICDEIERAVFSKKAPPEDYAALIECALSEAIFKKTGVINQHFLNLFFKVSEGKLLSKTASVLIALSPKSKKQQEIADSSNLQARDVSKMLNKLLETDIIARNGSFYRFRDNLFSFWLQSVYLKRILSFGIDEALERDAFKKTVANKLDVFMRELEKELSSRIMDLFRLFKNDVIQLNGRKHKFPLFGDVQKVEDNGSLDMTRIFAAGGKNKWLCTIRKEYVTENDITDIIKRFKKDKKSKRLNRHVLVSLAGINENAYLLAKEARFLVWDLESLNILMEIYDKPRIS